MREEKCMLILTRRCAESLIIGDGEITVIVLGVKGNQVRIGVNAPKEVAVHRRKFTCVSRKRRTKNQAINFYRFLCLQTGERLVIIRPVLRRGGRVAEGAPLLREYTSKGCRGFESPLLRHYLCSTCESGFFGKLLKLLEKSALQKDFTAYNARHQMHS